MAACAVGRCVKSSVIGLRCGPRSRGLVAAFTIAGDRCVNGCCWLCCEAITGAEVATRTLCAQVDVLVELARVPTGIPAFVAGVAVADGDTSQRCVGDMVCIGAIRWWGGAVVAT